MENCRLVFNLHIKKIKVRSLPSLIQINNEHHIISEASQSVSGWHNDDKCKHIVNKRVESLQIQILLVTIN